MTTPQEPHELLGVSRNASEEEIRSAFRNRAKDVHPDLSDAADAAERFEELRAAYEFLLARTRLSETEQPSTRETATNAIVTSSSSPREVETHPRGNSNPPDLTGTKAPPADLRDRLKQAPRGAQIAFAGIILLGAIAVVYAMVSSGSTTCEDYADLTPAQARLVIQDLNRFAYATGSERIDTSVSDVLYPGLLAAACQTIGIDAFEDALRELRGLQND